MLSRTTRMHEMRPRQSAGLTRWLLLATVGGICITALSGCSNTIERLEEVGQPPKFSEIKSESQQNERPDRMTPMKFPSQFAEADRAAQAPNSLWRTGAKTFFRDQRANSVGDILTVKIKISDRAQLDNKTEVDRNSTNRLPVPDVYGLQNKLLERLPNGEAATDPTNLLGVSSTSAADGEGKINRKEQIETQVAATVKEVLPNGNLSIYGSQEIRVNFELRQISVEGIIRPEDIQNDNTIDSSQIAEARINYGGKGQVTEAQQPRIGNQLIDILSPF